ncbi:MAG: sulfite exporter TauE/SafE family protein [Rhodobacteraceae bacterium]|nr:MAG: sulfite exporter TauE/SafE family protein [Paracoccaceae bacterium]
MPPIDAFIAEHGSLALAGAAGVLFLGGFAKGLVGFALPVIAVSGLGQFLPAQEAVGLLIVPTIVSNFWQASRLGVGPLVALAKDFRILVLTLLPMILLSAQLLVTMGDRPVFLALGLVVTVFVALQLFRVRLPDPRRAPRVTEAGVGLAAGFVGGLSGVWGPPIMMYLVARNMSKTDQMAAIGLLFLLGALALGAGHLHSGVLDARTAAVSALGVIPTAAGMALGLVLHDRMDAEAFRRATLFFLAATGLNLLRRGLWL